MSKPLDDRQNDLFAPPLAKIINLRHPLVRLAAETDWPFFGRRFGAVLPRATTTIADAALPGSSSSSTWTTSPMRSCPSVGSRTLIFSSSAAS
jgi:hypothetical protein